MSTVRVDTAPLIAGRCVVSAYAGHGVRADAVPAGGTDGASPLLDAVTLPADAAVQLRGQVVRWPTLGVLDIGEDGAFDYTGASDYFDLAIYADGQLVAGDVGFGAGIARVYLVVGAGLSQVSGTLDLGGPDAGGGFGGGTASSLGGGATLGDGGAGGGLSDGVTVQFVPAARFVRTVKVPPRKVYSMGTAATVDPIDVAEEAPIDFIYTDELAGTGLQLVSASFEVDLRSGDDPNPAGILLGAHVMNGAADTVQQWVKGQVPGATYGVRCVAVDTNGTPRTAVARLAVKRL